MQIIKKIQWLDFLQINKTDFKILFIFNHATMQRHICQLKYQKTDVCAVNLLSAIFGDQRIKGFREIGE